MTRNVAFALYFDAALENQVLKVWNILARRQITSLLIEAGTRPHICLCLTSDSDIDLPRLEAAVESFATQERPLAVTLSALGGICLDDDVLFLAPIPTLELLGFHARFHELLDQVGLESSEFYQPGSWFPHCRLAQELPKSSFRDALGMFHELKLPLTGHVCQIAVVELQPYRDFFTFSLQG